MSSYGFTRRRVIPMLVVVCIAMMTTPPDLASILLGVIGALVGMVWQEDYEWKLQHEHERSR